MNIKKQSFDKPLAITRGGGQTKAQQEFKSLTTPPKPGSNGVILHVVGCHGNHLGKC